MSSDQQEKENQQIEKLEQNEVIQDHQTELIDEKNPQEKINNSQKKESLKDEYTIIINHTDQENQIYGINNEKDVTDQALTKIDNALQPEEDQQIKIDSNEQVEGQINEQQTLVENIDKQNLTQNERQIEIEHDQIKNNFTKNEEINDYEIQQDQSQEEQKQNIENEDIQQKEENIELNMKTDQIENQGEEFEQNIESELNNNNEQNNTEANENEKQKIITEKEEIPQISKENLNNQTIQIQNVISANHNNQPIKQKQSKPMKKKKEVKPKKILSPEELNQFLKEHMLISSSSLSENSVQQENQLKPKIKPEKQIQPQKQILQQTSIAQSQDNSQKVKFLKPLIQRKIKPKQPIYRICRDPWYKNNSQYQEKPINRRKLFSVLDLDLSLYNIGKILSFLTDKDILKARLIHSSFQKYLKRYFQNEKKEIIEKKIFKIKVETFEITDRINKQQYFKDKIQLFTGQIAQNISHVHLFLYFDKLDVNTLTINEVKLLKIFYEVLITKPSIINSIQILNYCADKKEERTLFGELSISYNFMNEKLQQKFYEELQVIIDFIKINNNSIVPFILEYQIFILNSDLIKKIQNNIFIDKTYSSKILKGIFYWFELQLFYNQYIVKETSFQQIYEIQEKINYIRHTYDINLYLLDKCQETNNQLSLK